MATLVGEVDALEGAADPSYAIVVPTVGRRSLEATIAGLDAGDGPRPVEIIVVDDRPECGGDWRGEGTSAQCDLPRRLDAMASVAIRVVHSGGRGPAAARNAGWQRTLAEWVVFIDDDVEPPPGWRARLGRDLTGAADDVVGVQGRIEVPLPRGRRPTDWERSVAGLETARWATADMAYRRRALSRLGGFDERFPRAYREDAELALRARELGRLVAGRRVMVHPVRPASWWVSVPRQRGNGDDSLMLRLHGKCWRSRAEVPQGSRRRHLVISAVGVAAGLAGTAGRRKIASVLATAWAALVATFALRRIRPGPRTLREIASMAITSAVIPLAASWWWLVGFVRAAPPRRRSHRLQVDAVLFDRDGTLIDDVPYNKHAWAVHPRRGAREALDRLRREGIAIGIVSNQSGVARGCLSTDEVARVNHRVEELLGPFDVVAWCPHGPDDGCHCRKPAPGLVIDAARQLGTTARACVVVGDIGADVEAARAAGARSILVPTEVTRYDEITAASTLATDVSEAADLILSGAV